jgi:hypothetical protein
MPVSYSTAVSRNGEVNRLSLSLGIVDFPVLFRGLSRDAIDEMNPNLAGVNSAKNEILFTFEATRQH